MPSREVANKSHIGWALGRLGHVALAQGDYARAAQYLLDTFAIFQVPDADKVQFVQFDSFTKRGFAELKKEYAKVFLR